MLQNIFNARSVTPFWGYTEINVATHEYEDIGTDKLFEVIKKGSFNLNYPKYYLNDEAKGFTESTFGNFMKDNLSLMNFSKINFGDLLNVITSIIIENYTGKGSAFFDIHTFLNAKLAEVNLLFKESDEIFRFTNMDNLMPIMPDGKGGPWTFFECFFGFGNAEISGQNRNVVKVMLLGND
jgi:hypothetical protein